MDIPETENKGTKEEAGWSTEQLHALIEAAPVIICRTDLQAKITYVNKKFEDTTGYSRDEVIDKPWFTLGMLSAENVKLLLNRAVKKLQGIPPQPMELKFRRKDGEWIWIMGVGEVIRERGKPTGFQVIAQDITERKQAENRIKKAAEEWRTTFDAISDLISIHDDNYRITRVNRAFAKVFKMEPKELIGKTCYEVVHGTSEPPLHCPHKRVLETGKPETAEFFEPHLGIYLGITASPIFNEKGKVVRSVHVSTDITERKNVEEQIIVTDRLASVGELVSGVAHELNNPLTSIVGFSELLLAANAPYAIKEDLRVINREAQRAAVIVKNLLTFARRHKPEKRMIDVNDAIQAVLDLRTYEQKVNNIMAIKYFASDLPKIMADGFQLRQVFLNVIINAEYFMIKSHGKGTLDIKTERDGNSVRASFTDDGPGIPEENMKYLFDLFFTTKEEGKGTGLGLSICHGIITEHGGRIYAKSDLGKGTTFVVELPVR